MIPNVLSIAGSDPSGGAGIQADLKTFAALGCYGIAAITSLTAQNTTGVSEVHELPPEFIAAQVNAVFEDIKVDAVKIGMAGSPGAIKAIAEILCAHKPKYVVLDPVMISQSGHRLISDEAIEAIKRDLMPLVTIITPNIPEAGVLLGCPINNPVRDAESLLSLGVPAALLKGGHASGAMSEDVLATLDNQIFFDAPRIDTKNNHGTGCTLSSAIAAYLAHGKSLEDAIRAAKHYVTEALRHADELNVGQGHGPVHHFYKLWNN